MNKICIKGPSKLIGDIKISGSKNSVLPILILSLFLDGEVIIKNVPNIFDVNIVIKLLIYIGSKIEYSNSTYYINNKFINTSSIPYEFASKIRASIWIIAPLLYRFNCVNTFFPGGCSIGLRPIDLHIYALKKLGVLFELNNNIISAKINGSFFGSIINLNKISVGATITSISAAILAEGTTIIKNSSKEPEVIDVINFLNMLGANIIGAGTNEIKVIGKKKLNNIGKSYYIPFDRIETGTFLIAAAISRGNITCENVKFDRLKIVLNKLKNTGASINVGNDFINLNMNSKRPKSVSLYTFPYPGFPTDMQPQFSILNSIGTGSSYIIENIFENRFTHVNELISMGANIIIKNNKIIFYGVNNLFGSIIEAKDLRSSISLVLAGSIAIGETIINNINYINRGYENIFSKLKSIGLNFKLFFD